MSNEKLIPYPYQEHDIQEIVRNNCTGLLVSSVGGRKTLTAVEVGLRSGAKTILVIAPVNTLGHWQETIQRQDPTATVKRLSGLKAGRKALSELVWDEAPGWYLCSPQWFARHDWNSVEPGMVIFDEIHTALNYTNRSRYKLHQLNSPRKLAMSGTPLRNKWENMWSLIRWVYPDLMPDTFFAWRKRQVGKWDPFAVQNWKVLGEKVPGTLVNSLPCYIQHLARERCCDFHPRGFMDGLAEPLVVKRYVELTTAQKRFYKQMEDNYVAWLTTPEEKTGKLPVVATLPIVARGILRTCTLGLPRLVPETGKLTFDEGTESPKLDDLLTVLEAIDKQPALILTHDKRFTKLVVATLAAAGYRVREWSGDISLKQRMEIKKDMAAGNLDAVVSVISAIGTGTDGIQAASNVEIWISEDEDATANEQARGRLDRPGQANQVLRIYIIAKDTQDEGIMSRGIQIALRRNKELRKAAKRR